jgi:integrase
VSEITNEYSGITLGMSSGYWRAVWRDANGKRKFKSLGSVRRLTKKAATQMVRELAIRHATFPAARTGTRAPMLGSWVRAYLDSRKDLAEGTMKLHVKTCEYLETFFAREMKLDRIDRNAAAEFRLWLGALTDRRGNPQMTDTTVCAHIRNAKVVFGRAVARDLIPFNPFDKVRGTPAAVEHNWAEIDTAATYRILAACPHTGWRCLFALCRWAGLRRGEAMRLTWADIDWAERTLSVLPPMVNGRRTASTKARRREVPMTPELHDLLREAFDAADSGQPGPCAAVNPNRGNIHRDAQAIISKAGLPVYSKPFHTLRKCCETEWLSCHPAMTVAKWLGHSAAVAAAHYHRPTREQMAAVTGGESEIDRLKLEVAALREQLAQRAS